MLYLIYGTDTHKSLEKAQTLINSLRAKKPDAAFVNVNGENWNASIIAEHVGGQGLFSGKYLVYVDRVTENAEAKESLGDLIQAMNESANIFIVLEGKLNADLKKKFEKYAEKIVVCDDKAAVDSGAGGKWGSGGAVAGKGEFNIFALGDALGNRDPFKAWSIYRQAVDQGIEPEAILGTLFWQAKSMSLAMNSKSPAESGLNSFVYGKSKTYSKNYTPEEMRALISSIVTIYHDSHRGKADPEYSTERLLLNCRKSVL